MRQRKFYYVYLLASQLIRLAIIVIATLLLSVNCIASDHGTLKGVVSDASTAFVPHAKVTLVRAHHKDAYSGFTNERGEFSFGDVVPGKYRLKVVAPGFQTFSQCIEVAAGQRIEITVPLLVGTVSTSTVY